MLGALEFEPSYKSSGNYDAALHNIESMADWLVKAHLEASDVPSENKFVGQVGLPGFLRRGLGAWATRETAKMCGLPVAGCTLT